MKLPGSTALVTGAAGGLGHYIARALAAEGVDLVLSDLPGAPTDELTAELRAGGRRVESAPADLTDTAAIAAFAEEAGQALGPIDLLVNNAGVEFGKSFLEQSREELETITRVNLLAVMELTRALLPGMLERRRGHVVNIASLAGKIASPYLASYAATKHGVVGFTHSLRAELGSQPVGFTAVCPVFISRVGMYGRLEAELPQPPPELSTMPPEAVGAAVVRGVRENRAEIIVANARTRAGALFYAAAPHAFTRIARTRRVVEFTERWAEARKRLDARSPAEPRG